VHLDKKYIADVLWVFPQENPHKVVLDSSNIIKEIYTNIAQTSHIVYSWLDTMLKGTPYFEYINIDLTDTQSEKEIFIKISRNTIDKNLIVYSRHDWIEFYNEKTDCIEFDNKKINLFDGIEAAEKLLPQKKVTINVKKGVVATNGSKLKNIKIKENG
jgi:hypothetical protein